MRLGAYPCKLKPGSLAHKAYGQDLIHERHRHRYEFNMLYREKLEDCGMSGDRASPLTAPWSRSSSSRITRGFSPASSIPNSSRSPSIPIPFSGTLSRRP